MTIHGGCLCGDVRFEITGKLTGASHCHCSMCRKAHGAAFGTYGLVSASELRILSGADRIQRYRSSPDVERTFCGRCGSTLQWLRLSKPDLVDIALGVIDSDPGIRPSSHIFVGSKAPWYDITDGLPQHAASPAKSGS